MIERRAFLQTTGALAAGTALAGCSGGQGEDESDTEESPADTEQTPEDSVTEVAVGPEGRLRFEPDEVEISVGDTVKWETMSAGHNVTSHPDASPKCESPEGTEPFTSYEGDQHFSIMDVGETFEHEFTVPGEYVYVCTPHAGQGMVGTVRVTE